MRFGLKAMLLLEGLFMFSGGLFGPIYAIFVEQVGGNILDAGIASFLFLISSGILVFLISKWENRLKHPEKMYVAGFLLTAVAYFGYIFVTTRMHLFLVQIILGVALAIYVPVRDALYTKFLQKGQETFQWGQWETEDFIIPAIAAITGSFIAYEYSFKVLFGMMSVIALLGAILGIRLLVLGRKLRKK